MHYPNLNNIYLNLHKTNMNMAPPNMFSIYKLALLVCKTYNDQIPLNEWTQLNFDQYFTSRQTFLMTNISYSTITGRRMSCEINFMILNGLIKLDHLNRTINNIKLSVKNNSCQPIIDQYKYHYNKFVYL
jgi:hypothetical protein